MKSSLDLNTGGSGGKLQCKVVPQSNFCVSYESIMAVGFPWVGHVWLPEPGKPIKWRQCSRERVHLWASRSPHPSVTDSIWTGHQQRLLHLVNLGLEYSSWWILLHNLSHAPKLSSIRSKMCHPFPSATTMPDSLDLVLISVRPFPSLSWTSSSVLPPVSLLPALWPLTLLPLERKLID